jgi:hypothetical protein
MCACRCGIRVHMREDEVRYIDGNPEHPLDLCGAWRLLLGQRCALPRSAVALRVAARMIYTIGGFVLGIWRPRSRQRQALPDDRYG